MKIFTDALASMHDAADGIQKFLSNPKDTMGLGKDTFETALNAVSDFRVHKKAWEGVMAAVNPKAKGKAKAKGKTSS